jgi:hypothetical protein
MAVTVSLTDRQLRQGNVAHNKVCARRRETFELLQKCDPAIPLYIEL